MEKKKKKWVLGSGNLSSRVIVDHLLDRIRIFGRHEPDWKD